MGIDYRNTPYSLPGCARDVQDMQTYLLNHRGFSGSDICLLTHQNATKANMLYRMRRLVRDLPPLPPGQFHELWMLFSGHGGRSYFDWDGDEADGRDDFLVSCDYNGRNNLDSSIITDDTLVEILLPSGFAQRTDIKFRLVFDCCHSGTMLDNALENCEADVCYLSGCHEVQVAADAYISGARRGAMTWSLFTALRNHGWPTIIPTNTLLSYMHKVLRDKSFDQTPELHYSRNCNGW